MIKYLVLLTGSVMFVWMFAQARKGEGKLFVGGAFLTWNLLISPIAETHYFSNLILPALLIIMLLDSKHPLASKTFITGAFLLVLSARWDELALYRPLTWLAIFIWLWLMVNKSHGQGTA